MEWTRPVQHTSGLKLNNVPLTQKSCWRSNTRPSYLWRRRTFLRCSRRRRLSWAAGPSRKRWWAWGILAWLSYLSPAKTSGPGRKQGTRDIKPDERVTPRPQTEHQSHITAACPSLFETGTRSLLPLDTDGRLYYIMYITCTCSQV